MKHSKHHLYIHTPVPIFQARVNLPGAITYPINTIPYDTVTTGAYTDIAPYQTLLLGTTPGADDLGRTRVKYLADATNIPLPRTALGIEDGTLDVRQDAYITVLDEWRIWAKIPYFDLGEGEDLDTGNDYKDSNIPAGVYNTDIPPVANTGPGFAGYINSDTEVITVEFPKGGVDLSYTMADGATIASYAWDVKDGTITVGTATDPVITATFPAGFRWVSLSIVDSNGQPHSAWCPVLAVDPDDDTTLETFQCSQRLEAKGQTLDIELQSPMSRTTYPDGTLVMFWWDEASDPSDRSHMKFIGWMDNENASVTRKKEGVDKNTTIHCIDAAQRLNLLPGFPQALEREESDSLWSWMPSLDMHKALFYLLFWHSTALEVVDFILPDTLKSYDAMRLDSGAATLFSQVDSLAQKVVPDHYLTCSSDGQLVVRRDWMLDDVGDRPIAAPIITEDYWSDLSFDYNRHPKIHVLRSAAVLSSTDWVLVEGEDTLPLAFSIAPGEAAAFSQGTNEHTENEGLALTQEGLNVAEGHRYALMNSRYGQFSFKDASREQFWDYEPAKLSRVQLNIGANYSGYRDLDTDQIVGQIKSISVNYTASKEGARTQVQVTLQKEEDGAPALTYDPETGEVTNNTYTPPVVEYLPDYGLVGAVEEVAIIEAFGTIVRTSNFQNASPTWEVIYPELGGTPLTQYEVALQDWVVDPFSPGYRDTPGGAINGYAVGDGKVWKIGDLFGTTPTIEVLYTMSADMSPGTYAIAASFGRFEEVETDNPWLMVISAVDRAGTGSDVDNGVWVIYSQDAGATWSTEAKINSNSPNDARETSQRPAIWLSPRTPGLAITFAYTNTTPVCSGFVSTDWGATWTETTDPDINNLDGLGGCIHVPWEDNEDESLVYHGYYDHGSPSQWSIKKVEGTVITDITPTISANPFGSKKNNFGLRAHDLDRTRMIAHGVSDVIANGVEDQIALFVSNDAGATWDDVIHSTDLSDFLIGYIGAAFDGVDLDTFFVWGGVPGTGYAIAYTTDFGVTIDSKEGNIPTLFGIDDSIGQALGIAGGPNA